MYTIDLLSRTPIYEQLYKRIIELISRGEIAVNEQLPSVRVLAKDLGINPNTVSKAYQELERDGIIYSLAGRGSYVSGDNKEKLKLNAVKYFDAAARDAMHAGATADELKNRIAEIKL